MMNLFHICSVNCAKSKGAFYVFSGYCLFVVLDEGPGAGYGILIYALDGLALLFLDT